MLIYENETKELSYTYYNDNGVATDISDKTPYLYVYNNIDTTATVSVTGTVSGGTGEFSFSVDASSDLSSLTADRYYPYRVVLLEAGELNIIVEEGILNYNTIYNPWEWYVDMYTGDTLTEILESANAILRYQDWSDAKLTRFANQILEDFSEKTFYVKGYLSRSTRYNKNSYILPNSLLVVDNLYIDDVEKYKNKHWIQNNKTITFKSGALEEIDGDVKGGQVIKIKCSKYPQKLISSTDYVELPKSAANVVADGIVLLAKVEDRASTEELQIASAKYKKGVDVFVERNFMDSLSEETYSFDTGLTVNGNDIFE